MLAVYTLLSGVCIFIIKYIRDYVQFWRYHNALPGSKDFHPLLGNLHTHPGFSEKVFPFDYETTSNYKYFHRLWTGPFMAYICVYHPETVKVLIKADTIKPRNSGGLMATTYDMGALWLGDGLVLSNGPKWARNRRLITPSFHFDILKSYLDIYNDCVGVLVNQIEELSRSNKSVEIQEIINKYTLDVILRCAFSKKTNCQTESEESEYTRALHVLQEGWMKRILNPLHYNPFIYKLTSDGKKFHRAVDVTHRHCESIIKSRQTELESNKDTSSSTRKVHDFLDTLLMARDDAGRGMPLEDMRSEVETFLFAGHDTTASGITWTLMCLAQNPRDQELVYQEVKEVMCSTDHVTYEALGQLRYTGQCIKEALRIHGSVPGIDRVTSEDVSLHGHHIKAGTHIFINLWALHNNPHVWDDPLEFRPERFNPDKVAKMDPYQYIPFSAGARNCIGQNFAMNEMKATIAKLIHTFRLTEDKDRPLKREIQLTIKAKDGAFVFATPREK